MNEEEKMDLSIKLHEGVSKLEAVGCSLEVVLGELKPEHDPIYGNIWGTKLIIKEVAETLMKYRKEYLGA